MNPLNNNHNKTDLDQEVRDYFRALGYTVNWDFNQKTGEIWHEISLNGNLVCQIDMGIPLVAIIEDLKCFARNLPGTSKYDYKINMPDNGFFEEMIKKIN